MTLLERLNTMRWSALEKNWIREWNELRAFAQSAGEGGVTTDTLYGDADYTDNCDPDVVPRSVAEEAGRAGLNGRYPTAQFPASTLGFVL